MRFLFLLPLLFMLACTSTPYKSASKWTVTKGTVTGLPGVTYDFYKSPTAKKTMIWMHGLEDSPDIFQANGNPLPNSYAAFVDAMPDINIVVPSWGPGWLLTGYPNRTDVPVTATWQNFHDKVLPDIEAKFGLHGPYILAGHSQGGFNVAQLCSHYPEMWTRCALINPMLIPDKQNPFNLLPPCLGCLLIKGGTIPMFGLTLFTGNYDTIDQWMADRPEPNPKQPVTWVTSTYGDQFNLHNGGLEYATKAHATYILGTSDHFNWDVPALVKFLNAD